MATTRNYISRFAPPLALMGLIYFLSAQSDLNSGLGTIDLIGRKIIHTAEYGELFGLWWRAFNWRAPLGAAAIAIGWAGLCAESHPDRSISRVADCQVAPTFNA